MTKEDAIYEIKQLAVLSNEKNIERITEALEMAIEALQDRKTEPTSSKMEQVETMSCQECKWWFTDSLKHGGYCQSLLYNHECRYEPEVDCSWK